MNVEKQVAITFRGHDETGRAKQSAAGNIKSLGELASKYGPVIAGAFGVATIAEAVRAYGRQEQAIFQLEQRLKSTGGVAGLTSAQLQNMASSLQAVTTYGDEATIEAQALLLTFTNIRGEIFEKAMPAILDMSTAMGQDLKSSTIQLGKALNDPIQGISALTRVGVTFTTAQKEQIRTLVESGQVAKAQAIILKELQVEFGGAANAARQGLNGALTGLKNAAGDALEKLGSGGSSKSGLVASIGELEKIVASQELHSGLEFIATTLADAARYSAELMVFASKGASDWSRWVQEIRAHTGVKQEEISPGSVSHGLEGLRWQIRNRAAKWQTDPLADNTGPGVNDLLDPRADGLLGAGGLPQPKKMQPAPTPAPTPKGATLDKNFFNNAWEAAILENSIEDVLNFQPKLKPVIEKPELSLGAGSIDMGKALGLGNRQEQFRSQLEELMTSMATEEQLIESSYLRRQEIINASHDAGLIDEQRRSELMGAIWNDREKSLTKLATDEEQKRAALRSTIAQETAGSLMSIGASLQAFSAGQSRKMFEASKVASIAGTIVSTYEGAQNAFTSLAKIPIYGPALGAAAAAAAVMAGMARVQAIQSTTFDGGGGGGGRGGGGSVFAGSGASYGNFSGGGPPVVTQPQPQQQIQEITLVVNVNGSVIGNELDKWMEDEFAPAFNSLVSRNGNLNIVVKRD